MVTMTRLKNFTKTQKDFFREIGRSGDLVVVPTMPHQVREKTLRQMGQMSEKKLSPVKSEEIMFSFSVIQLQQTNPQVLNILT